jgi:hypothetical protein
VKNDVKVYRRPGKVQTAFVVLVCLGVMVVAAYAGLILLSEQPIGLDIHWLEKEFKGSFD